MAGFIFSNIPQADVDAVPGSGHRPKQLRGMVCLYAIAMTPGHWIICFKKPSLETLQSLTGDFLYLLDAGIWLLSDHALRVLFKTSGWEMLAQNSS